MGRSDNGKADSDCTDHVDEIVQHFIGDLRDLSNYSKSVLSKIAIKALVVAGKEDGMKIIKSLDKL